MLLSRDNSNLIRCDNTDEVFGEPPPPPKSLVLDGTDQGRFTIQVVGSTRNTPWLRDVLGI
jgi:hypothetical protein